MTAFFTSTGAPRLKPIFDSIHRWLYAKSKRPLDAGHLFDTDDRIGVCGDWCRGDRVEDAFLSGLALAKAVEQSVSI